MVVEAGNTVENITYLQKMIDNLLQKEKSYKSEIKILNEQIKYLQNQLFGRKSEKKPINPNQVQLSLFDMPEEEFSIGDQLDDDEEIDVPAHKRGKRGRRPIPDNLPVIEVVHDIKDSEMVCECGCLKERIGEETSKQLDIIPAKIQVVKHIRPKYTCKHCEGVESEGPTVSIAPMPEQVIPKCIGPPGLIAYVLVAKFVDALPFYRQEKQLRRIGVEISRATMCSWARKVAESCEILLMMLRKEIVSGRLINIDETPTQVFKEPNKSNTTKSYMWVFRGGTPEHPGILFEYHPSRSGDVPAAFLNGYQGVVQTDGYSAYSFLDAVQGTLHMGCWAHVRRKFMDVVKAAGKPKGKKKSGKAGKALSYIRKLYKIEKDAKAIDLTGDTQAKYLLRKLNERMGNVGLELHPEKTKIVYCKDTDRQKDYSLTSFDFLGYTFRARRSKSRWGKFFINFSPAISNKAAKAIRQTSRKWNWPRRSDKSLEDLAQMFNPVIQGWINYYGRFYKSALYPALRCLDRRLVIWATRKYKRFRGHRRRASQWLERIARRQPNLFVHWRLLYA